MSKKRVTRREFLRLAGITGAGLIAAACAPTVAPTAPPAQATTAPATQPTTAPAATAGPRTGGTLRIADTLDGTSIGYPAKLQRVYSNREAAPAVETLLRIDASGKPVPWLATNFTTDPAKPSVTLTLRQGVKFHDGTDFNAEAVKWNLNEMMVNKMTGTSNYKSIDVVDANTVRINLATWDNSAVGTLARTAGMIVSPTAVQKSGADWAANNPVGTGPFQFVSWVKDSRITYKKFDSYWQKGKPYLDGIEYNVQTNATTRTLSFRNGELDLVLTVDAKDLAGLEKDGFMVTRRLPGSGAQTMVPDSINPNSPFSKLEVRQAVNHAIDNEAIVKTILYGEAEVVNQWIYKGHWGYNPAVVGYPYDPAKAKQLLAAAGYPNGFKTKLTYRVGSPNDQVFAAVQGYFKDVGIELELNPVQTGQYDQLRAWPGKWEGLLQGAQSSDPDLASALAGSWLPNRAWAQMVYPEDYVAAVKNSVTAPDLDAKAKSTQEAMKLMVDKYAMQVIMYVPSDRAVSRKQLHNHGFYVTPDTSWWTPEEAWLEK